jgi:hypothetical protein
MIYGAAAPAFLDLRRPNSMSNTDGPMTSSGMNTIKDLMTEADTFNALRRISYDQLYTTWQTVPIGTNWYNFCEQYNWTDIEFYTEYYKRQHD